MRKQRTNLNVLENAKLTVLHLQQIKGGGPEDPEDDYLRGEPGKP